MSEMEETLRAELLEAQKLLDQAASLEEELQGHDTGTLLADARVFRVDARKQYRRALRRFTSFVMGGILQADVGQPPTFLGVAPRSPDRWRA